MPTLTRLETLMPTDLKMHSRSQKVKVTLKVTAKPTGLSWRWPRHCRLLL